MMKSIDWFHIILEESNYSLNQFVKGNSLSISNNMSVEFVDALKKLLDAAPIEIRTMEERESFWDAFENFDEYEKNNEFIEWLKGYTNTVLKPFDEAAFLHDMDEKTFQEMTEYCFQNLILKDIGKKRLKKSGQNEKQMIGLRKIIFTFLEMAVIGNLSKENIVDNMNKIFGIKESFCELWWNRVEANEEKLWRIMITRQYRRIEDKLDRISEAIEN